MAKIDRQKVLEKYGGKCGYCGCELTKGWHVDHIEPIGRNIKSEWDNAKRKWSYKTISVQYPERENMDNYMPSCASCNINKHGDSIEGFRKSIEAYMKHLNEHSTQYKIAKRYGLLQETNKRVTFYYETITKENT